MEVKFDLWKIRKILPASQNQRELMCSNNCHSEQHMIQNSFNHLESDGCIICNHHHPPNFNCAISSSAAPNCWSVQTTSLDCNNNHSSFSIVPSAYQRHQFAGQFRLRTFTAATIILRFNWAISISGSNLQASSEHDPVLQQQSFLFIFIGAISFSAAPIRWSVDHEPLRQQTSLSIYNCAISFLAAPISRPAQITSLTATIFLDWPVQTACLGCSQLWPFGPIGCVQ